MGATITIDSGNPNRVPFVVVDPDAAPGTARIELVDTLPGATDWPSRPLIGISPAPKERVRWHKALPSAAWSRVFYGKGNGLPDLTDTTPAWLIEQNKIVHASAKDAGTAAQLRAEFDTIPDGVHYKRTFWHERQGDNVEPGPLLAQDKLIRQVRDDHPRRDQIELVGVHTLYASEFKRDDWRRYVSTDVDTLSFDTYWGEDIGYRAPESLLGLPIAALGEFGFTRWEISEIGASQRKAGRAAWYGDVIDYAASYGCQAVGIWLTRKVVDGVVLDYRPQDDAEIAEFRKLCDRNLAAL
jgi:hypothetical protein